MSTPFIRGFQLDSSAIGDAAKSVNLYRGDVNLPLKLVHLAGPHGLDLALSAYYSSNVLQQFDTWNRQAPTSLLGLGWSCPFDLITFSGGGTASWLEGSYTLNLGGNAHPLTLVSSSGNTLRFCDALNPLWSITYSPDDEKWTIVRDDGMTLVFGDSASSGNTVQWGVRWGNWAGSSSSTQGNPQQFGLAWNLSTVSTPWENQLTYAYTEFADDSPTVTTVNGTPLTYTRACYLSLITDGYNRTVRFTYGEKDALEYQAPHTINGSAPSSAYQDRYETRYLSQIDVCPPGSDGSVVYYSLLFGFEVKDLGATPSGEDPTTDCCKRYLTSVTQQREGVNVVPAMRFTYNLEEGSTGVGRLTKVTYPAGGEVTWTYQDVPLADPAAKQNIFNLTYEAKRPSSSDYNGAYTDAYPRLWFGGDYVIVGWYAAQHQRLLLQVYSYGGRWSDPWAQEILNVNPATTKSNPTPADQLDAIQLALGSDFFALYFHNAGDSDDTLYVYQNEEYQFGQWAQSTYALTNIPNNVPLEETVLVAGQDIAAIHVGGTNYLLRLLYNRVTKSWSQDTATGQAGETKMALTAQHNTLAVAFFSGTSQEVTSAAVIYYLDADFAWQASQTTFQPQFLTWDSSYASSYWQLGQGFAAGTYRIDANSAQIHCIWWERNFTGFSQQVLSNDSTGAPESVVVGSTLLNGAMFWRFDGNLWQSSSFSVDPDTDYVSLTDDTVLRATRSGGAYTSIQGQSFNAVDEQWKPFDVSGKPLASDYPIGPVFAGDFLTLGATVYYRTETSVVGGWQQVANNNPLPKAAGSTLANLGPIFLTYQNYDNREGGISPDEYTSYVAVLKNGDVLSINDQDPFTEQRIQTEDSNVLLCGGTAFATYPSGESNFGEVGTFTLHRILNYAISDQTDCVVAQLTISTGDQTLITTYDYTEAAKTAVFDPSGQVAQYPQVTSTRMSAVDGKTQLGQSQYHYFNGLSGNQDPTMNESADLNAYYSLANGYMHTVTEYDSNGNIVGLTTNTWGAVIYTTEANGGFCPIVQTATLKSKTVERQFPGLAVMPLDGSTSPGTTATLAYTQAFHYDEKTAYVSSNNLTQYDSQGVQDTRTVSYLYAWTKYVGMHTSRQLKPIVKILTTNNSGPIQACIVTYSNAWGTGIPAVWDQSDAYFWSGAGSTDFDYANPENNAQWAHQGSFSARNANGFLVHGEDALGVTSTTLYDAQGLWPIAKLANTINAAFTGFQTYENVSDWTFSGTGAGIEAGDAHSGSRCAHLPAGATLTNAALKADGGTYVFSCWVKGATTAAWMIKTGGGSTTLPVPQGDTWQYVFKHVETGTSTSAVTATLTNSGNGLLLVDDIRFTPLVCRFFAKVYDETTHYEVARLGANGETQRTFYDNRLRTVGSTGPDENVRAVRSRYYTASGLAMFEANDPDPNSLLTIAPRDGGPWDDFRDGAGWQTRWTGSASAWTVVNQALTHQGTSEDTVTLNGSDDYKSYGVQVTVAQQQGQGLTGMLGLTVGSDLTVRWNPSGSQWELLIDGAVKDQASGTADGVMHWLLIAGAHGIVFCVNDKPILSYAAASSATAIEGQLAFFATDAGVGFSQVLVFKEPLVGMTYTDGTNRSVQEQMLADNQIFARQRVFDELGRAAIQTKVGLYDETVLGYQPSFVTSFDFDTGVMTGDVADYYAGQDGRSNDNGYPYARKRSEDSALARLQETGLPGADFAIGANGSHTTTYTYGVNGPSALFNGHADTEQQYNVRLRTDPDDLNSARVSDQFKTLVGQVSGAAGLPSGSLVSAYRRDGKDNIAEVQSPNAFNPPAQPNSEEPAGHEPSEWSINGTFDYRNACLSLSSPDTGTKQGMHDNKGRLRFTLDADGAKGSAESPCASNANAPVTVIYRLYDDCNRVTEIGYTCVAAWDNLTPHVNDQTWPQNAANWRYRMTYDGDGALPFAIGRLNKVETNNGGTTVTETFAYDIRGNTTGYTIDDGVNSAATTAYRFDTLGRITSVTYPTVSGLDPLTVVYGYDTRSLLATIGTSTQPDYYARYTHNAAGQLETATIGNGSTNPITRTHTYASPGWLKSISDALSAETLYYQDSPPSGGNTPRYNGQVSALHYTRTSDSADYTWLYTYDDVGRLENVAMGSDVDRTYAYDGNGNLTKITDKDQTTTFTYAGTNFLQSANGRTFTAMPAGDVKSAGDLQLSYDFTSRLTKGMTDTQSNETVSLIYGSSVQRLSKTLTDSTGAKLASRRYIPGTRRGRKRALVEQAWTKSSGQTQTVRYIYGPTGILAIEVSGAPYFVLQDHQRSNRVMAADAKASPVATFDYLPFGQLYGTAGGSNPDDLVYRYTGQEWDAETELYNYRHRLYDPAVQRFYAPDPKRQYFSPYLYVGDAPLLHTDPTGENSKTFGYIFSAAEIVIGVSLWVETGGLSSGLVVGGIAGITYTATHNKKHFNTSQFLQVDAAALISTEEIEAGVGLEILTFGGSSTLSSMMIGAGVAGLGDVASQEYRMARDPNQKFSWAEWGIVEGVGALTGLLGYGIGVGLAPSVDTGVDAGDDTLTMSEARIDDDNDPPLPNDDDDDDAPGKKRKSDRDDYVRQKTNEYLKERPGIKDQANSELPKKSAAARSTLEYQMRWFSDQFEDQLISDADTIYESSLSISQSNIVNLV